MRAFALLGALSVLIALVTAVATTRAGAAETIPTRSTASNATLLLEIAHYQRITWRWQRVIGRRRTPSSFSPLRSPDPAYRQWVLRLWKHRAHRAQQRASVWLTERVRAYRDEVDHWEHVMAIRRGPLRQTAATSPSLRDKQAVMARWRARAQQLRRQAAHPPYESAWQCIHRYEGAWSDSGGPYYGGLQMDLGFQRHYGGYLLRKKGTADNWTPQEQMWVAVRALRSGRGFYPWPNTARACGLI